MKLKQIIQQDTYRFTLIFDGEVKEADLKELIGPYIVLEALSTSYLNTNRECLGLT